MSFKDLDYRTLQPQNDVIFPPTDYTKKRSLPASIVVPSTEVLRGYYIPFSFDHLCTYVVNMARGLKDDRCRLDGEKLAPPYTERGFPRIEVDTSVKTVVVESADLRPLDWSSFPIRVDDVEVILDFGDWHLVNPTANQHNHWLRFHFHSSYKSYPYLGSFPPASFLNWEYYEIRQREIRERRDPKTVEMILNNQSLGTAFDSRRRRRLKVRETLVSQFGSRANVVKGATPIAPMGMTAVAWHALAEHALCYIQVPGSWENILDRGQLQMMGLGIPTISPYLTDQCGDGHLQPGVHYLMCRQDYRDVPDLVHWCQHNREEAAGIGHNAWMFFQEFCTPIAVWSYIKDRIENGPRHWRQNIDDDLSPPALYAP